MCLIYKQTYINMNLKHKVVGAFTLSIMLLLTSCSGIFNSGTKGNGNLIVDDRKVDVFSKIDIDGVFNVILDQGSKEAVRIEADENLVELIEVKVSGNTLFVDLIDNASIGKSTKLNVFITLVNINELSVNGVGDVSVKNPLVLDKLELDNSGVGDVNLVLDCNKLDVENSSVGDITLSGRATNFNLINSGVGAVLALELDSKNTEIDISGVGDVKVNATHSIDIETSGVGDVEYSGNPKTQNIEDNAVGDVEKL